MYKISIIIPVYNTARYLQACIESLQKQSIGFGHLEIILADDHSTDHSRELMKKYEEQNANIRCIYLSENSGAAGRPRNEAMKLASAPYLMFLDSDDFYFEHACENLYQAIEQTGAGLVSGYFSTFDDTDGILEENIFAGRGLEKRLYSMPKELGEIAKFKNGFFSKIYRRSVIEKGVVLFPEKIIGQDSVFMWDYLFHVKDVYYLPVPVVGYRIRKGEDPSVSFTLTRKHFEDVLESMRLIWELFVKFGQEEQTGYAFGGIHVYYIGQMIDSDLSANVLEELLKSWEWLLVSTEDKQEKDIFTRIVMRDVRRKEMREAAEKILLLREQKGYQNEIEKAREWWRKQAECKDQEIKKQKEANRWWQGQAECKDQEIEKLKEANRWWQGQAECKDQEIIRLAETNDWWKKQAYGKDQEIDNLKKTEKELRKWVQELEEAKAYFLNERK